MKSLLLRQVSWPGRCVCTWCLGGSSQNRSFTCPEPAAEQSLLGPRLGRQRPSVGLRTVCQVFVLALHILLSPEQAIKRSRNGTCTQTSWMLSPFRAMLLLPWTDQPHSDPREPPDAPDSAESGAPGWLDSDPGGQVRGEPSQRTEDVVFAGRSAAQLRGGRSQIRFL